MREHVEYLAKLDVLLNKIDVAMLGEEPEMRQQLLKIRLNTVEKMKEEEAIIKELKLLALEQEKVYILGSTSWFDNRFVWLGCHDQRVDSMGEYTFMKYYEKDMSYARSH